MSFFLKTSALFIRKKNVEKKYFVTYYFLKLEKKMQLENSILQSLTQVKGFGHFLNKNRVLVL